MQNISKMGYYYVDSIELYIFLHKIQVVDRKSLPLYKKWSKSYKLKLHRKDNKKL
jgi:hypothetical protein